MADLILNLESNWQLPGKISICNEGFRSSTPFLSLTLNLFNGYAGPLVHGFFIYFRTTESNEIVMRFKRIKEDEPGFDIAPLIDIVFLLLIFFMLTSHFQLASGVHIKLPKMGQKLYEKEDNKIVLVIDKRGNIYLKGEKVELKDLGIKLHKLVEKDGLDQLLLEADQEVKHGRVVKVMDIAKRAGMSSIAIAAGWEPEKVF